MNLEQWAIKWAVPYAALADLRAEMGLLGGHEMPPKSGNSEAAVQAVVTLEGARKGYRLWRNNVGGNDAGLRWGLANTSPAVNKILKSGDLIGWRRVVIEQHHVGQAFARFTSRENKRPDWAWTGTDHEQAQLNWANLVNSDGGDAGFATGEGTL